MAKRITMNSHSMKQGMLLTRLSAPTWYRYLRGESCRESTVMLIETALDQLGLPKRSTGK